MRQLQGLRIWEQRLLLRWLAELERLTVVSDQLLFLSGRLTGNWTIQTGQGGFVSPPKAKLPTSNWRIRFQVRERLCLGKAATVIAAREPVFLSLPRAVHGSPGHALGRGRPSEHLILCLQENFLLRLL